MALQFVEEAAFHFDNHDNSDKIWAAGWAKDAAKAVYIAVWGRRKGAPGAADKYQTQTKGGTVLEVESLYDSKVREKKGKGYIVVGFNDPRHGSIPSFANGNLVVAVGATGDGQQITAAGLLRQIESLIGRLVRKNTSGAEMSGMIMEFQQVKAKTEIFIEFGGASGDEKAKIAGLTSQLQSRLTAVLVG
jgi:hypothetical protein